MRIRFLNVVLHILVNNGRIVIVEWIKHEGDRIDYINLFAGL